VLSKPLRVAETAERVALGLYVEDTAVESQQLLLFECNDSFLTYGLHSIQNLTAYDSNTLQNVLDVKRPHSVCGLVAGATSWITQGSNPVMKKISFSSSNRPDRLWSPSNLRFNWYRVPFPG